MGTAHDECILFFRHNFSSFYLCRCLSCLNLDDKWLYLNKYYIILHNETCNFCGQDVGKLGVQIVLRVISDYEDYHHFDTAAWFSCTHR